MPVRDDILKFTNHLLSIHEIEDYCVNGLQVEGKEHVTKIVLGVSSSQRLFAEAVRRSADMIIVHHGIFWKSDPSPFALTGVTRHRIALLINNDINLVAYHLPLDCHPELGNNAQILKKLNLEIMKPVDVGFVGRLSTPLPMAQFIDLVNERLGTKCTVFPFGDDPVSQVLVISGDGAQNYFLALENGADTFITGNIREPLVRTLEEVKLNLINAGHYNTECLGVQALGVRLEKEFNVQCEFIDIPNPV